MQVQMPKFAKISSDFICIYKKNRWQPGDPIVTAVRLSLYLNIAGVRQGPGKMLLRSWKVLEIFLAKRVGILKL